MAIAKLNSALQELRGRVGDLVYKQYSYGTVVTRVPQMEGIKPTAAQRAHRNRVRLAGKFYQEVLADPVLLKRCSAIARKRRIPLPAVTLAEYFKAAREGRRPG
jgi:hypothetical protein